METRKIIIVVTYKNPCLLVCDRVYDDDTLHPRFKGRCEDPKKEVLDIREEVEKTK